MLHEILPARHTGKTRFKRWFQSREMDLFIWFRQQVPVRFLLCYNKLYDEHAISWEQDKGFHHYRVDNGESITEHYKQSPLLLELESHFDTRKVAHDFLLHSDNIEASLADFIFARLLAYPVAEARPAARRLNRGTAINNS